MRYRNRSRENNAPGSEAVRRQAGLFFLTVLMLLLSPQTCHGDSSDERWKPWLVTLTAQTDDHYLEYPGSSLHPLTRVKISYAQPDTDELEVYESLFYAKDRAIGCKRFVDLDVTPGTVGIVRVLKIHPSQTYAVTNALRRVYLELCLSRCMTKYIKIPRESFDDVVTSFGRQGFHPPSADDSGEVSLRLVSEPAGKMQILVM